MNKGSLKFKNIFYYLNNFKKNYKMGLLNLKRTFNKKLFYMSLWMNMSLCCLYHKHFFNNQLHCLIPETKRVNLEELVEKISVLQHNANSPSEDTFIYTRLDVIPGYFLAVLDGHGGPQIAEYASKHFVYTFQDLYNQYAAPSLFANDEAVIKALEKTFEVIVCKC
jgi:hypothetical protein